MIRLLYSLGVGGSLVPQGSPVCMKCPLGLSVFLRSRPHVGLSGHVLVEIVEKLRGERSRTGRSPGPTLKTNKRLRISLSHPAFTCQSVTNVSINSL